MDITLQQQNDEFYFRSENEGVETGRIYFSESPNNAYVISHTHVHEAFKGQNIGKELVYAVAAYARKNGKKVVPRCSYAAKLFSRDEELKELL
jgi:predicted GNAT family acetyltransferase